MEMKKFLSIALALLMLAVMLPVTALAAEGETTGQPKESGFEWVDDLRGTGHIIFYDDGSQGELQSHTFGDDNKCTACYYLNHEHQLTWKHEVNGDLVNVHTGSCKICQVYVTRACTYEENSTICTTCGFDKTHIHNATDYYFVWDLDGKGYHNGNCSTCGWFYEPHVWNGNVCTICGYDKTACAHSTLVFQPEMDVSKGAVHFGFCEACHTSFWGRHNTEGSNGTCSVCGYPLSTQPEDPTPAAVICLHACNTCGGCTAVNACNGKACTCDVKNAPTVTAVKATISSDQPMGDVTVVANEIKNAAKVTESIKAAAGSSIPDGLTLDLVAAVFDIHLEMSGEIVPAGNPVTVTLPVGTDCAKAISEGKMVFIHFGKDNNTVYSAGGKAGTTPLTVDVTAGTITFTANEFSPFALLSVSTPSSEPQVTVTVGSDETEGQKNPSTGAASNSLIGLAVAVAGMTILGSAVLLRKK